MRKVNRKPRLRTKKEFMEVIFCFFSNDKGLQLSGVSGFGVQMRNGKIKHNNRKLTKARRKRGVLRRIEK